MRIFRKYLFLFLLLFVFSPVFANVSLQKSLDDFVKLSDAVKTSDASVYVCNSLGKTLYEYNSNMLMAPASNLKILTTASALHYLGSDYRYKTSVYGTPIDKERGVMESSLYLVGSGDPTFREPFLEDSMDILKEFAQTLSEKGLRRFTGDLIGDDSVFDREFVGLGWKKSYMLDEYAAQCAGLSLNSNLIRLTLANGISSFIPDCSIININDKTTSGTYTEINIERTPETNDVTVNGTIAPWEAGGATFTIHNPSLFTTDAFDKVLKNQNIYMTGNVKLLPETDKRYKYSQFIELASHESPAMLDILKVMMKESDNLLAQHIFKTIGAKVAGHGTRENSEKAILDFLKEADVDVVGLSMADGCGLSVENRISTKQMGKFLSYMLTQKEKDDFISTFPKSGVDGTLRYRMQNLDVRAKTGTINGCSSLCGYVKATNGEIYVFAVITNNHTTGPSKYKGFEDSIAEIISRVN